MAPRKTRHQHTVSDYESDLNMVEASRPPMRTVDELNLQVIRRWNPEVGSIEYVAPYAVIYVFSPDHGSWEKSGIEGTAFVCRLHEKAFAAFRYSVFVLNRRGMNNFDVELKSSKEVEITPEYIIIQTEENGASKVYGLWIFSEPPPSSTAGVRDALVNKVQIFAGIAERSRDQATERQSHGFDVETEDDADASVLMGRQLSLRELFGQQRREDAAFSVHTHSPRQSQPEFSVAQLANFSTTNSTQASAYQDALSSVGGHTETPTPQYHSMEPSQQFPDSNPRESQFAMDPDTQFFRHAPQKMPPPPKPRPSASFASNGSSQSQQDALLDLFRKASNSSDQQDKAMESALTTGQSQAQKGVLMDLFKKAGEAHKASKTGP